MDRLDNDRDNQDHRLAPHSKHLKPAEAESRGVSSDSQRLTFTIQNVGRKGNLKREGGWLECDIGANFPARRSELY